MKGSGRSISFAFLVLVVAQAAHSFEEYVFRLYDRFAPAMWVSDSLGLPRPLGFLAANGALVLFGLWCYFAIIRPNRALAPAFAWGWAVVELLNGLAHIGLALAAGGYFPGLATAPFLIVIGLALSLGLAGRDRAGRSVEDSRQVG